MTINDETLMVGDPISFHIDDNGVGHITVNEDFNGTVFAFNPSNKDNL